jgi:hypothetical protein
MHKEECLCPFVCSCILTLLYLFRPNSAQWENFRHFKLSNIFYVSSKTLRVLLFIYNQKEEEIEADL